MGIGGALNYSLADRRLLEHAGPSSSDGLADSTRVINVCLEAAGSEFHPGPFVTGSSRPFPNGVLAGWIDDNTEEELVQYLYGILQTHGLSPALGACSSSASEFVLNINRAGSNAGLGTFALYFQLHDGLARRRGDRSVEHNLRATGQDARTLGTDARTLGTDAVTLGTGLVALGLDKTSLKISKHAKGTSKWARNSSTAPRLLNTNGRKLLCHACNMAFKAADTVMQKFDHPVRNRGHWPRINCRICKANRKTTEFHEVYA